MDKAYKEVALKPLLHNGIQFEKGDVVRERVTLRDKDLKILKETPELTNCEYVLLGTPEPKGNTKDNPNNIALMTKEQLSAIAKEKGFELTGDEKKVDLLKLLKTE